MNEETPEAGWYRDPLGEPVLRYWDGQKWGRETKEAPAKTRKTWPFIVVAVVVVGVIGAGVFANRNSKTTQASSTSTLIQTTVPVNPPTSGTRPTSTTTTEVVAVWRSPDGTVSAQFESGDVTVSKDTEWAYWNRASQGTNKVIWTEDPLLYQTMSEEDALYLAKARDVAAGEGLSFNQMDIGTWMNTKAVIGDGWRFVVLPGAEANTGRVVFAAGSDQFLNSVDARIGQEVTNGTTPVNTTSSAPETTTVA